ncbi:uncharacterized protein LOC109797534 [Cajanus cajan]|uniref:Uncharacterized protein n=1 Tax=Cajanus cajan TaxID=3821 RepID=A0A151TY41_CAJCA|nr:uncharacterized protein LOC109797534 [Cajanus cajan]KYP71987.1 hypothetical protein KK1_011272 [Cajanus cajan]
MWCCEVAIPKHAALVPSVSATSWRRGHGVSANASQQGGKLGQTLLATLQSESSRIPKAQHEGEISGSDVLWALQRASARKKKKKKKEHGRGSSSVPTPTEETTPDYTNVRPLRINANWSAKLDQFDKRLRQLSDTI